MNRIVVSLLFLTTPYCASGAEAGAAAQSHVAPLVSEIFTTPRMRAEKTTAAHRQELTHVLNDRDVQAAYMTTTVEKFTDIDSKLSIITTQWNTYGYGLYTLYSQKEGTCIGFAGYHTTQIKDDGTVEWENPGHSAEEIEVYLFLLPTYWRQKYGTEIMEALFMRALTCLPPLNIIAYINKDNTASLSFMENMLARLPLPGAIEQTEVTYDDTDTQHTLFRYVPDTSLCITCATCYNGVATSSLVPIKPTHHG